MGVAMFWTVVGTLLLVGVVASVTGRRRRRQQLMTLFENPDSVRAAQAAERSRAISRSLVGDS